MAVTRTTLSANLRVNDPDGRRINSVTNVNPDAAAPMFMSFAAGIAMIRGQSFGGVFVTTTDQLKDA